MPFNAYIIHGILAKQTNKKQSQFLDIHHNTFHTCLRICMAGFLQLTRQNIQGLSRTKLIFPGPFDYSDFNSETQKSECRKIDI